ncbi:NusG domain II-containing protein [Petrocella sp. FN5]|uniref:NusG domain II-containing protein n=1 Tax=Petrocella sp. FN5 TaxID=3032002 RepID=UPI0023DC3E2B|nr:NusG domain II-containing protein [Petrocella sp. FN5]MDF1617357.1 NusG domain II-containing protein [Petrocella sp. FN5]
MKKNDLIIIGSGLLIALLVYLIMAVGQKSLETDHLNVEVYVDGELLEVLPLDEDGIFTYETENGRNVLEIHDHKASIIEATCPDQICVSSSDIFRPNQNIVCLPFRFHVLVQGEGEVEFDAISQ